MNLETIRTESLAKGHNFFSAEIKGAYKTRYSKRTAAGPGGVFFVTSEEIPSHTGIPERRFAVRSYNPESGVVTLVSSLGQYATDYAAHTAAKTLANPEPAVEATAPEHVNDTPPAANEPMVEATTPVPVEAVAPLISAPQLVAAIAMIAAGEELPVLPEASGEGEDLPGTPDNVIYLAKAA